jgi:cytochrome c peroxidase
MTHTCTPRDEAVGAFRTPTLLNIAETAPYFHNGAAKSLEEVVWHYNQGGGVPGTFAGTKSPRLRPLGLTESEISDLIAFLQSLTGEFAEPTFAGPPDPAHRKPPLPTPPAASKPSM